MRLNVQTDLALRMLIYLAAKQGSPATIQEITQKMGLSQSHMMRVAAKLASNGLVASSRGRGGGLSLGRDASEITVEEVVKTMEPDYALVECLGMDGGDCVIESACVLKGVLVSALEGFFSVLRNATLAQLVEPKLIPLAAILNLGRPRDESKTLQLGR
ncbi:MAG TPA: Rrf2 family transcriptional regulator [Fimbriimonadaceae bacterium]|nr:Rrf2 family transcriptional regulator [Fimbriimonadaceae bacterium]